MANTITNLIPDIYNALDVVSRELTGFIPAVTMDATYESASVGQTVRSPVAPAVTASDATPGVTPPDDGNQTIGNVDMTITKDRRVPIRWNGEQSRGVNNGGPTTSRLIVAQFAQAFRTLLTRSKPIWRHCMSMRHALTGRLELLRLELQTTTLT
jgi:hypothetical protein